MLACGSDAGAGDTGSPRSFDGPPLVEAASSPGALQLSLRASPSPPTRGVVAFELAVADVDGLPLDGLAIAVVPWMPAMGHGVSVVPTVTAEGGGKYLIDDVSLSMAGHWVLRTTLARAGVATDSAELGVDVR